MKTLSYHLFWIKCASCDHESRFPVFENDGYILMRNPRNLSDIQLLAWPDSAFQEVGQLVKKIEESIINTFTKDPLHRKIIKNSIIFEQRVFSFISDPINGIKYEFDPQKICSACGSYNISGWGPTENPYEKIEAFYPFIKHEYWDGLTQDEKEIIVKNEVEKITSSKLQALTIK